MQKNLKCSIHKLFMNLEKFHYGSILAQKLKNHIFGPFWVPFGLKTSHQKKSHISQFSSWNKLHFAHTWTFVYMKMFAVHDCAHKNRVLMSSLCTGAKISAKTPLCQAVYKIQIRTNPLNVLRRPSLHLIRYFLKQYHVSWSDIGFLCPSYRLHLERAPCMCFCSGCGRAILEPSVKYLQCWNRKKIIHRELLQPRSKVLFTVVIA